jgi:hypothetical protein
VSPSIPQLFRATTAFMMEQRRPHSCPSRRVVLFSMLPICFLLEEPVMTRLTYINGAIACTQVAAASMFISMWLVFREATLF